MIKSGKHYGYVYITTNLCNGMKYIGQHGGDFSPRYKGSGAEIKKAFSIYGRENFRSELLCYAESFDELNELESYYINYFNAVESEMFYNKIDIPIHWDMRNNDNAEYLSNSNHSKPDGFSEKIREIKISTNERKGKMYWITDGTCEHLVNEFEHKSMYPDYVRGRIGDLIYMYKGDNTVKVSASMEKEYLDMGYARGKSKRIVDNINSSRQHEIWSYCETDFRCARELTDYLRQNGYPNISKGTVVNLSKGAYIKSYPDLFEKISRRKRSAGDSQ